MIVYVNAFGFKAYRYANAYEQIMKITGPQFSLDL